MLLAYKDTTMNTSARYMFVLPKHLQEYIFKLSRKAALRDNIDQHLRSRPRFKNFFHVTRQFYYAQVTLRLNADKTCIIEYTDLYYNFKVTFLDEGKVHCVDLFQMTDGHLVCDLCTLYIAKWYGNANRSSDTSFISLAKYTENMCLARGGSLEL